jgi:hypothetical protein
MKTQWEYFLTRSLTIRPSRRATATLSTVRRTRKKVWNARIKTSLDLQDGNVMRKRMALSCLKNVASMLGLDLEVSDNSGK